MAMNKVKNYNDADLKDRLVAINRVTKVTKGGRTFTFAAIVVVGDGKGVIGYGLGKAGEVTAAIAKGVEAAKKNLVKVPVLKGTIPHEVEARFGGAQVFMRPAAAGTGLVAGGAMRAVLDSVGVKDILAKSKGSSNPHNLVKATIEGLSQLRDAYTIAGVRGISMDKVFNGLRRINTMATIKVQQIKSKIGAPKDQKATLVALGLRKISQVVEVEDTPSNRGMIRKVHHLVTVVE